MDLKIYIEIGMETCLARRIDRDMHERGRRRDEIIERFEQQVVPMYERYVAPMKAHADLVVDGEKSIEVTVKEVVEYILPEIT